MMKLSAARWRGVAGIAATSLAVGTLVLVLAACGGSDRPEARTYTIHGTVTIVAPTIAAADCRADGYYSDLREGAKILVEDLNGTLLDTATLGVGKPSPTQVWCDWTFSAHVPAAQFYKVTIPHRGEVVVPFSQLKKDQWSLKVTA